MKISITLGLAITLACMSLLSLAHASNLSDGLLLQDRLAHIKEYVHEQFEQNELIGGVYGVIYQGELIDAQGFGTTDKRKTALPNSDTVYAVASVTKVFTAAAIYQLQEQGLLDIDRPVSTYIPEFRFRQEKLSEQLTLRHLMTHSAGGVGFEGDGIMFKDRYARDSIERYVSLFKEVSMKEPPGTSGNYCNGCFDILGHIIERVTGISYYEYMDRYLFAPLGMKRTVYGERIDTIPASQLAQEYSWMFMKKTSMQRNFEAFGKAQDPDGGIYSSVDDLTKLVAFHLGYADNPLYGADSMIDSRINAVPTGAGNAYYTASGFEAGELHGTKVYWKVGDGIGSGSIMLMLPEYEFGVVLLIGEYRPGIQLPIAEGMASLLLGYEVNAADPPLHIGALFGFIAISLVCISIGLFVFLIWKWRTARPAVKTRPRWNVMLATCWGAVAALFWYLVLFVRPSSMGIYGYPYDVGIGLLMIIAASTLCFAYYIYKLIKSLKKEDAYPR